ncbi:Delta(7)-sterol 5(6)-desaturase-like [Homarus americanus]|uniref:Delta(7)-sterol 5(6)-desaturase-like n=1 Tax=Homarus americanus TaxID=6706 RepID=A0A8J5JQU7_HOMAM|nr:Delta(7)-sterol 5(6)-desaturase-like [Homarus americanus]
MDHETKSTQETSPGMVSRIPNDPMAVTWAEKYSDTLEKYWNRLPNFVGTFIASVAVFILGSTIRGRPSRRNIKNKIVCGRVPTAATEPFVQINSTKSWWYYYIRQRGRAIEWKCQPNKFLSPELERHEILLGSFSLLLGSTCSALVSCYLMNGGKSTIYYDVSEYGWLWYFASWPVVFVWQDYLTYWTHRMYHLPFLYKKFHKLHHKYKQPTAFSVTAIHPFEFLHMQLVLISPMVIFPVHWTVFVVLLMYLYYHGIIDHSGINFKAYWWQPWQPDCIFHDNHHQYFHVNFGFNCALWDKIHGTYRQKNKVYREDIFYGKGKDLTHCSKDELKDELRERENENHLAYRGTVRDEQVKEIKHKLT